VSKKPRLSRKQDCYEYVRTTYGVPAFVGGRVRIGDKAGVLVRASTDLHYLHVRFDGVKFSVNAHPTDGVTYLQEDE
jgi:hypothetical protein